MDESEGFAYLVDGLKAYEAGDRDTALASWKRAEDCGALPALFAMTLLSNLQGNPRKTNPYQAAPGRNDYRQIELFDQIRQLEFVHIAEQLVATVHSSAPAGSTLLDLGIGRGEATAEVVAASRGAIERVIGVDIDPANVEASRDALSGLDVEYVGLVEDFSKLDWKALRQECGAVVSVNAAFSLHHLDLWSKKHVLAEVAALKPTHVTLVEASSSQASADMLERLIGCYAHYAALWSVIKASTIRRDAQRSVLRFLGREISDIMRDDPVRFQRNEHWNFWYQMLLRAGLRPVGFDPVRLDPEVVQLLPGAANVHARKTHLVSVFSFKSND